MTQQKYNFWQVSPFWTLIRPNYNYHNDLTKWKIFLKISRMFHHWFNLSGSTLDSLQHVQNQACYLRSERRTSPDVGFKRLSRQVHQFWIRVGYGVVQIHFRQGPICAHILSFKLGLNVVVIPSCQNEVGLLANKFFCRRHPVDVPENEFQTFVEDAKWVRLKRILWTITFFEKNHQYTKRLIT